MSHIVPCQGTPINEECGLQNWIARGERCAMLVANRRVRPKQLSISEGV